MIKELVGPKKFDFRVYAIGKLAHDVQQAFCNHFKVSKVYYYFESCRVHRPIKLNDLANKDKGDATVCACGTHRIIWCGPGILNLINTAYRYCKKYNDAPTLFCTPHTNRGAVQADRDLYKYWWNKEDEAYEAMRNCAIGERLEYEYQKARYDPYQVLYKRYREIYDKTEEVRLEIMSREYWIGDVMSNGRLACCDPMFGYLWDEVTRRDSSTGRALI